MAYNFNLPEVYKKTDEHFSVIGLLPGSGENETYWLNYRKLESLLSQSMTEVRLALAPSILIMPSGYFICWADTEQFTELLETLLKGRDQGRFAGNQ